jgi:hypothetical protein
MNLNDILYVPLDLPKVPHELSLENIVYTFVPTADQNQIQELKSERKHHLYAWNSFIIRSPVNYSYESYSSQLDDIDWKYTDEAISTCPNLIEYIEKNLPYKKLNFIAAISSRGEVPMHFDHTENISASEKEFYKTNDPCYYRILLDGTINDNSFYVYTKRLGKKYCRLPKDSPGWAMGSYNCAHGNDESLSGQKLLLYVMGELDIKKHQGLLHRSLIKFKDFSIIKNY